MRVGRPILLGGLIGLATGAGTTAGIILAPSLIPMAGRRLASGARAAVAGSLAWQRRIDGLQDLRREPDAPAPAAPGKSGGEGAL